ncbi:MAG: hypothetical protein M3468_12885 [Acidobacteriota bacterium]|nr:hypothetical protein [Acidobacteriota bacterium]
MPAPNAAPFNPSFTTVPDAVPDRSTRMTSVIASASSFAVSRRSVLVLAEMKRPVTTVPSMVRTFSGVPGSSIMTLSQRPTGEGAAGRS